MSEAFGGLRTRLALLAAVLIAVTAVLVGLPSGDPASAATSRTQCYYFDFDGVRFHNYDYLEKVDNCNAVDWATSVLFYDWADIDFVKSTLDNFGFEDSSWQDMYMPVRTGNGGAVWDDDGGKKEIACPAVGLETRHYRIYAPPSTDYMYHPNLGYFVVGSTHWDANECPPIGKHHYGSEEAEQTIANRMEDGGYFVSREWSDYDNWEPYRVEGDHTWENSGYATYIATPYPG
ncbi:hypothetical protein AB0J74_37280 [Asanoa sp. NPDC049573]|uniref:hypothetical protein n=1 Tax=Asanoa sp. NPDC049573 TaxID=3155396 RepID=UPI00342F91C8